MKSLSEELLHQTEMHQWTDSKVRRLPATGYPRAAAKCYDSL